MLKHERGCFCISSLNADLYLYHCGLLHVCFVCLSKSFIVMCIYIYIRYTMDVSATPTSKMCVWSCGNASRGGSGNSVAAEPAIRKERNPFRLKAVFNGISREIPAALRGKCRRKEPHLVLNVGITVNAFQKSPGPGAQNMEHHVLLQRLPLLAGTVW